MKIVKVQITAFMDVLGLMQDQASPIYQRVQGSNDYTEELLNVPYTILEFFQTKFAIRGLGFTVLPRQSGIENCVLIALVNRYGLSLNPSKQVVRLGPGNSCGRFYDALEREGRAVTREGLAVVGISGLLTGSPPDGVSLFPDSRGFSSADVVTFEVVLAGGKVSDANNTTNTDLWHTLKGGSNNFGIVTRFDMNTFPLPNVVWSGKTPHN
ncbi:mitomycin radical oxidase [Colletotrichum orchidophilum]|uniref:Mitomycin radical oxidase n=1 Tax=Colletotrichum orchidophilum TaxID=1209926 RepID=A0A1G4AV21_9PEZI|nr:mitomycin radical oxidase [Colletotrichum orchidophilum]OHE93020.1 mitomycin radical oxidase [Colletotrichum orchidophilum]